jgi:heme-degrading monooxygenase HmoA
VTFAATPEPPYTAVIFSSTRTEGDHGYARMSERMFALAAEQPGYLGAEAAREGALGITVSYWIDDAAAAAWKQVAAHLVAQERGRSRWYDAYRVRVATVTPRLRDTLTCRLFTPGHADLSLVHAGTRRPVACSRVYGRRDGRDGRHSAGPRCRG